MDSSKKKIYLVFSAHEFGEGGSKIASTLHKLNAKASFFFTGDFYRDKQYHKLIKLLKTDGHYLGAHSDKHLLYADWSKRDSLLISQKDFDKDLSDNYRAMMNFGIDPSESTFFLPPYEWYNKETVDWASHMGLTTVNFTPGTRTNADYTTPEMSNYRSTEEILTDLNTFERKDPNGLNGAIILIHLGTSPSRTDKLYNQLDNLLESLKGKGYEFCKIVPGN
jgi:peptidoglycan/xylan/chitin deacetylase (PgdA/CDA1 family)